MTTHRADSPVLITGITGFVGAELRRALESEGWRVVGTTRRNSDAAPNLRKCDLCSGPEPLLAILSELRPRALIHAASAANSDGRHDRTVLMAQNTARALATYEARPDSPPIQLLHLSSVSVYGEAGRAWPVGTPSDFRPADAYGRSKVEAERVIRDSGVRHVEFLRLTPVYNQERLRNLQVRARLPGIGLSVRILPEPRYSLCHTDTLNRLVSELLREGPAGHRTRNVADPEPMGQHDLLRRLGKSGLPLPRAFAAPLYHAARLLPGIGHRLRCLYWKLFRDNLYSLNVQDAGRD